MTVTMKTKPYSDNKIVIPLIRNENEISKRQSLQALTKFMETNLTIIKA